MAGPFPGVKISALPAESAVAATDLFVVVQSGVTKKVAGSATGLTLGSTALTIGSTTTTVAGLTLSGGTLSGTTTLTGFTAGSVLFAGTSGVLSQNNTSFFWDNGSIPKLGIGTSSPGVVSTAGRAYLTLKGSTGAGVVEFATATADADLVFVGQNQWTDVNSTSAEKRVGAIQGYLRGSTANNRGGAIVITLKNDNGVGLSNRATFTETGLATGTITNISTLTGYTAFLNVDGSLALANTSAGGLIVGSLSSFNGAGGFARTIQLYAASGVQQGRHSNDTFAPALAFTKSRHATVGSHTTVQAGDDLMILQGAGSDGTSYFTAAQISAGAEGTISAGVVPGNLRFSVANAAGTLTERAKFYSGGDLRQGTGTAIATTATDGFLLIATCAGAPTGVPTNVGTGQIPLVYDKTNNQLYIYNGGWKQPKTPAGAALVTWQ